MSRGDNDGTSYEYHNRDAAPSSQQSQVLEPGRGGAPAETIQQDDVSGAITTTEAGEIVTTEAGDDPSSSEDESDYVLKESARVHPLSQLVLLFFQTDEGYEWISGRGMTASTLRINDDGTFVLAFPVDSVRNSAVEGEKDGPGEHMPGTAGTDPSARIPQGHIWTYYDATEGKHWLCASVRDNRASRFLLQDCSSSISSRFHRRKLPGNSDEADDETLYTPWRVGIHGNPKPTLADKVEDAVRAAMQEVDRALLAA